jgi:hypothetical protein
VLQVHALGSFRHHSTLAKSRGCEVYAVDKASSPLRLCVAIKKRLILYQWDGKQFNEIRVHHTTPPPPSIQPPELL